MPFQSSSCQRSFYLNRRLKVPTEREAVLQKPSCVPFHGADCSVPQDFGTPFVFEAISLSKQCCLVSPSE